MSLSTDIVQSLQRLEKGFVSQEERFAVRVLRTIPSLRKKLTPAILAKAINLVFKGVFSVYLPTHCNHFHADVRIVAGDGAFLNKYVSDSGSMDTTASAVESSETAQFVAVPDVQFYLVLLVLINQLDSKNYSQVSNTENCYQKLLPGVLRRCDSIPSSLNHSFSLVCLCRFQAAEVAELLMARIRDCKQHYSEQV
jgi:hypothetical protein